MTQKKSFQGLKAYSLRLCNAGIRYSRALQDTLRLGAAEILGGWALQGYSAVKNCRDTQQLGTAGILCGWALQGLRLGTALLHHVYISEARSMHKHFGSTMHH